MSSVPEPQQFRPGRPSRPPWPWMLALLTVLIAGAAVYLITNHWLHILDALPYLGVVLMMGMHLFMHGGHGGHGGPGGHGSDSRGPGGDGAGHVH
ncbi:DUF2933 domain-containing protein [Arthrobacter sp. U41]|uniref:DUF2933 domain-containing protein n=1 Tax=Arthrobacter sp. U41 TaxID=1849032 RepID=UPI0018D4A78F|nr:DUF2933 domain-containing protein [Arthrobacter sp. U41]